MPKLVLKISYCYGNGKVLTLINKRVLEQLYPNTRINQILNESEKKYHIWVEVNYDLKTNEDTKEDIISITIIKLNCIQPEFEINTKFEINTTMKQINNNHNIITI